MIENKILIGVGITSILAFLIGINYVISQDTFFCQEKGVVQECLRFSESGNRCYPNLLDNKGYKDCSNWIKLNDTINLLPEETINYGNTKQYECNQKECIPLR